MKDITNNPEEENLLESIDHDEILGTLGNTLKHYTRRAQDKDQALEKREYEIIAKIDKRAHIPAPATTWNADDIEKSVEGIESEDTLWRKVFALRKAKGIPWTTEPEYREAMLQYLTYIIPILTDLEEAKQDTEARMQELYKGLSLLKNEYKIYESKVYEILSKAGLQAEYVASKNYNAQFGARTRADQVVSLKRKAFIDTPVPVRNDGPVITHGHGPVFSITSVASAASFKDMMR